MAIYVILFLGIFVLDVMCSKFYQNVLDKLGIWILEAASISGSGCFGERGGCASNFSFSDVTSAAFVSSFIPRVSTRAQSERRAIRELTERTGGGTREQESKREREQEDEASSRQLPPLELQPNRHWPLHESVQGSQHLPEGDHRGGPQQDRHPRLDLPKGGQDNPLSILRQLLQAF